MFPNEGRRPKHGKTSPFASTVTEVMPALQLPGTRSGRSPGILTARPSLLLPIIRSSRKNSCTLSADKRYFTTESLPSDRGTTVGSNMYSQSSADARSTMRRNSANVSGIKVHDTRHGTSWPRRALIVARERSNDPGTPVTRSCASREPPYMLTATANGRRPASRSMSVAVRSVPFVRTDSAIRRCLTLSAMTNQSDRSPISPPVRVTRRHPAISSSSTRRSHLSASSSSPEPAT